MVMGQFLDLHIRTCGEGMPFRGEPAYCVKEAGLRYAVAR